MKKIYRRGKISTELGLKTKVTKAKTMTGRYVDTSGFAVNVFKENAALLFFSTAVFS